MILYILQKNHGNKWTEISQILEGRAENTIKNHWNASMSKKLSIIETEIEARLREACEEADMTVERGNESQLHVLVQLR